QTASPANPPVPLPRGPGSVTWTAPGTGRLSIPVTPARARALFAAVPTFTELIEATHSSVPIAPGRSTVHHHTGRFGASTCAGENGSVSTEEHADGDVPAAAGRTPTDGPETRRRPGRRWKLLAVVALFGLVA